MLPLFSGYGKKCNSLWLELYLDWRVGYFLTDYPVRDLQELKVEIWIMFKLVLIAPEAF
jgi:hypothetical protein